MNIKTNIHALTRWSILFLVQLWLPAASHAQIKEHVALHHSSFHRLGIQEGLPSENIYAVAQDAHGFIWVATNNGLVRYDGRETVIYRSGHAGFPDVGSDTATALKTDRRGHVWIGTERKGVVEYDPDNDRFEIHTFDPAAANIESTGIWAIEADHANQLWVLSDSGQLARLSDGRLKVFDWSGEQAGLVITALASGKKGELWLGSADGQILRFSEKEPMPRPYFSVESSVKTMAFDPVLNDVWVGTTSSGAYRFSSTSEFKSHYQSNGTAGTLDSNMVTAILVDSKHRIWIATASGLSQFRASNGQFINYRADASNQYTLAGFYSTSLSEDSDGYIWIGSAGGLSRWDPIRAQFSAMTHQGTGFCLEGPGIWWVATWKGLYRYDMNEQTRQFFAIDKLGVAVTTNAHIPACIFESGYLWFSLQHIGLVKLDPTTGTFAVIMSDSQGDGNPLETIYRIVHHPSGVWLLATLGSGVQIFSPANQSLEQLQIKSGPHLPNVISEIQTDIVNPSILWIGTGANGLFKVNLATKSSKRYHLEEGNDQSLSHDTVTAIRQDNPNEVWIGTDGGGLNRLDVSTERITRFSSASGIASSVIDVLLFDKQKQLWVCATGQGIIKFDPAGKQTVSFDLDDGGLNECVQSASLIDDKGNLFFGSTKGAVTFSPGDITKDMAPPRTILTQIKAANTPVALPKPLWALGKYVQGYRDPSIEIAFAAIGFGNPKLNRFEYRLKGAEENWIESQRASVAYSRLPPGSYQFEVRSANRHKVWSKQTAKLLLIVEPPPWKTWWAYTVYASALLGAIAIVVRWQRAKLAAAEQESKLKTFELENAQREIKLAAADLLMVQQDARIKAAERELELSAAVQTGFLPESSDFDDGHVNIAGFYRPASICGGDLWWYEADKNGLLDWIFVGDVTGHGAASAMVTAAAATALRLSKLNNIESIDDRLHFVHNGVQQAAKDKYHMTATCIGFDENGSQCGLYFAGGTPVVILNAQTGESKTLVGRGSPLGYKNFHIGKVTFPLEPGQRLLLSTDGIIETKNDRGREMGLKKIAKVLTDTREYSLKETSERLVTELDAYRKETPQDDDWTFVLVERSLKAAKTKKP